MQFTMPKNSLRNLDGLCLGFGLPSVRILLEPGKRRSTQFGLWYHQPPSAYHYSEVMGKAKPIVEVLLAEIAPFFTERDGVLLCQFQAKRHIAKQVAYWMQRGNDMNRGVWSLFDSPRWRLRFIEKSIPSQCCLEMALGWLCRVALSLNPLQIRAKWFVFRHWRKVYRVLWGQEPLAERLREACEQDVIFAQLLRLNPDGPFSLEVLLPGIKPNLFK